MREKKIDILSNEVINNANAICFTSNGVVNSRGSLVMGAGIAKAFADKWAELPSVFGKYVQESGNRVYVYEREGKIAILNFPTKHDWKDKSDLGLIVESAKQLMGICPQHWKKIYLPRPGTGLGQLKWSVVKSALKPIFDDRIIICSKP